MALLQTEHLGRVRTGTYLGIFASAYASLFLAGLLAEQLGVAPAALVGPLFWLPAVLLVVSGLALSADSAREYFTAGRSVSPYFSGLSIYVTALGGVGMVCMTGALFMIGVDALALMVGWVSGIVIAGVMLFPFVRKCGAYSVPSFLGLRLDSRSVRMLSALLLAIPTVVLMGAELGIAAFAASWMTGASQAAMLLLAALLATFSVLNGGMRALTWSAVAQSITALAAVAIPATIVSLIASNLPLPQLMHGNSLRGFDHIEVAQHLTTPIAGSFEFTMPGAALDALSGPYLQAFAHVGRLGWLLAVMVIATGLAGLPAVLGRAGTSPTVYEARKSVGWAVLNISLVLLTLASVAGFLREYLDHEVVNALPTALPQWFQTLLRSGDAELLRNRPNVGLADIAFRRDAAFFALPLAAGLPQVIVMLAAMGSFAAALAAAAAHLNALAAIVSEDLVHGGRREPPEDRARLSTARWAAAACGGAGLVMGALIADPLAAALVALALSSATVFPVLVLSILWRKVSRTGAVAGMLVGFAVSAGLMVLSFAGVVGGAPLLSAAIAGPLNLAVMAVLSGAAPLRSRRALEVVHELRLPGGEAIYDREMRLLRRKRATGGI